MFSSEKVQDAVLEILRKDPSARSATEVHLLVNETKSIQFFKEYIDKGEQQTHRMCCSYMKHEYIQKDHDVFKINTIGTKFYIIISGCVGVYIRIPKPHVEEEVKNEDDKNKKKKTKQEIEQEELVCVKELRGGSFGELALLHNKPRAATIKCHSNSHFATLNKKEYDLVLKKAEEDRILKQMGFFARLPIFKHWNINLIRNIFLNSFRLQFTKNDKVFVEGTAANAVYIVNSGEFILTKKIELENQDEKLFNNSNKGMERLMIKQNGFAQKDLEICVINPPELVGEDDLLDKRPHSYSFVCYSAVGEVIMIQKIDFLRRIMVDQQSAFYIRQRMAMRQIRIEQRIISIHNSMNPYQHLLSQEKMSPLNPKKNKLKQKMIEETYNNNSNNHTNGGDDKFPTTKKRDIQDYYDMNNLTNEDELSEQRDYDFNLQQSIAQFSPSMIEKKRFSMIGLNQKFGIHRALSIVNENKKTEESAQDQLNESPQKESIVAQKRLTILDQRQSLILQFTPQTILTPGKELDIPGSPLKNQPKFVYEDVSEKSENEGSSSDSSSNSDSSESQQSSMKSKKQQHKNKHNKSNQIDFDEEQKNDTLNSGSHEATSPGLKYQPDQTVRKSIGEFTEKGAQKITLQGKKVIQLNRQLSANEIDGDKLLNTLDQMKNSRKVDHQVEEQKMIFKGLDFMFNQNKINRGVLFNVPIFEGSGELEKSKQLEDYPNQKLSLQEERNQLKLETMKVNQRITDFHKLLRFQYYQQFKKDRVGQLKNHIDIDLIQLCPDDMEGPIEHPFKIINNNKKPKLSEVDAVIQNYRKQRRQQFLKQSIQKRQQNGQSLESIDTNINTNIKTMSYSMYKFNKQHLHLSQPYLSVSKDLDQDQESYNFLNKDISSISYQKINNLDSKISPTPAVVVDQKRSQKTQALLNKLQQFKIQNLAASVKGTKAIPNKQNESLKFSDFDDLQRTVPIYSYLIEGKQDFVKEDLLLSNQFKNSHVSSVSTSHGPQMKIENGQKGKHFVQSNSGAINNSQFSQTNKETSNIQNMKSLQFSKTSYHTPNATPGLLRKLSYQPIYKFQNQKIVDFKTPSSSIHSSAPPMPMSKAQKNLKSIVVISKSAQKKFN